MSELIEAASDHGVSSANITNATNVNHVSDIVPCKTGGAHKACKYVFTRHKSPTSHPQIVNQKQFIISLESCV